MESKRYFIVFLKYYDQGKQGNACLAYETDGCYLNRKQTTIEAQKDLKRDNVVITNILELSYSDYCDFIEGDIENE